MKKLFESYTPQEIQIISFHVNKGKFWEVIAL